jgi:fatty-acyl-CoA synthase
MTVDVSLAASLAASARRGPDLPAVTDTTGSWTYGEMQGRVMRLAAGLRAHGVRTGDRVGFLGKNSAALLEVLFATSALGGVFVPLNWRLAPAELEDIVLDAGLHTLFLEADHADAVTEASRRSCRAVHLGVPAELYDAGALPRHERVAADQTALLMYTSGTTGRPKGVVLTHGNLWWNAVNVLLALDFRHDDVSLVVAPMFHIGGLNMTTLLTLQKGGHVVVHAGFEPAAVLDEIERSRVTSLFAVPAMLSALQQEPGYVTRDLSSLRMVVCGGAPVPPPLLHDYFDRGVAVLQGYGMTETAPAITLLPGSQALAKVGSAGTPVPFVELRLAGSDGAQVPPGECGEICVRGPNVTPGYWAQPAATAAAFDAEGWLHTGDIGYLDGDGCLYVVDRL